MQTADAELLPALVFFRQFDGGELDPLGTEDLSDDRYDDRVFSPSIYHYVY